MKLPSKASKDPSFITNVLLESLNVATRIAKTDHGNVLRSERVSVCYSSKAQVHQGFVHVTILL